MDALATSFTTGSTDEDAPADDDDGDDDCACSIGNVVDAEDGEVGTEDCGSVNCDVGVSLRCENRPGRFGGTRLERAEEEEEEEEGEEEGGDVVSVGLAGIGMAIVFLCICA